MADRPGSALSQNSVSPTFDRLDLRGTGGHGALLGWRQTREGVRYHRLADCSKPCAVHGSHFVAQCVGRTVECPTLEECRAWCRLDFNSGRVWRIVDPYNGQVLEVIDATKPAPAPPLQLSLAI